MKKPQKAFTLVELIITIVILSILATIAFLSFSSYSSSSRDSVRLSDISNIAKGLVVQYSIGGSYIIPDNSINIYSGSTTIIGYQGKVGSNTINTIKLSNNNNSGKDPLDNTYYTYNINYNKSKYQVTGYLESKGNVINRTSSINDGDSVILNLSKNPFLSLLGDYTSRNYNQTISNSLDNQKGISLPQTGSKGQEKNTSTLTRGDGRGLFDLINQNIVNQTYSTTYTNRYPYTKGDSIGVILSYTGGTGSIVYTPLEDSGTGIDISSGTLTNGKIVISNNTDSSTGVSVNTMSGYINTTNSNIGCGSDNGQILASTPTNLCSAGTASSVLYYTGAGTYNWNCGLTSCKAYDNYTKLLLHFDGNLINNGLNAGVITNNNSVTLNSAGKFSSAAYLNGINSYLSISDSSDWNFGNGDFTIDWWEYRTSCVEGLPAISRDSTTVGFPPFAVGICQGGTYTIYITSNGSSWDIAYAKSLGANNLNIWTHFAVVRSGNTFYAYQNGIQTSTWTSAGSIYTNSNPLSIGRQQTSYYFPGYFDEIRISKGIARWITPSFVVPNIPY